MRERGFMIAGARILRRAWQIYVAHIFLFAIYMAEISYVATSFENPLYAEEMNILDFLKQPDQTIIQALLLKFKPVNMDVLPLYIVLLLLFPPILWLLLRWPTWRSSAAAAFYTVATRFDWNLPAYPSGVWFFNPFAWQLLFVFGAWCALGGAARLGPFLRSPVTMGIAIAYLLFAFLIAMTWCCPEGYGLVPHWLDDLDVSDRQDQSRRAALCAFPGAGGGDGAVHPARLAGAAVERALAGDPVRAAFAGNLLPRRVPGLCRPFRDGRNLGRDLACRS